MSTHPISAANLDPFLTKPIDEICPLGYTATVANDGSEINHCAHFVSHVLKLNRSLHIGYTCAGMLTPAPTHPAAGACIRVNEIFNACEDLEAADETGCLVYFTLPSNMHKDGRMGDMKKKHVGIYVGGWVWNYHNHARQVGKDKVMDLKNRLYGPTTIIRYTVVPEGATLLTLDQIKGLAK
jgi:hypothetical protein